jgi:hypothetical protein
MEIYAKNTIDRKLNVASHEDADITPINIWTLLRQVLFWMSK